jgi:hypothetical protein
MGKCTKIESSGPCVPQFFCPKCNHSWTRQMTQDLCRKCLRAYQAINFEHKAIEKRTLERAAGVEN